MLDRCEMKRMLDALPWPESTKPCLQYAADQRRGFSVLLHEPHSRRGASGRVVSSVVGPTPEGALRLALSYWLDEKGLKELAPFDALLRRLMN